MTDITKTLGTIGTELANVAKGSKNEIGKIAFNHPNVMLGGAAVMLGTGLWASAHALSGDDQQKGEHRGFFGRAASLVFGAALVVATAVVGRNALHGLAETQNVEWAKKAVTWADRISHERLAANLATKAPGAKL